MLEQPLDQAAATVVSSRRRFSIQVAWTFIARILMTINSVAAVINVAVGTIVQLSSAGLPSANTYFIAQERRYLAPAAINSLLFALIVGGLLAFGLTSLAAWRPGWFGFIPPRLIGIAAISIPFQLVTLIGLNIFLALGRIEHFSLLDLAGQSFGLINAIIALLILN